jgi:hypothetical protein
MNKDKLIAEFAHGIEEGRYATVMAIGARYALFRVSGHSASDGRSHPRTYVPVQFVLIRRGQWWMGRDVEKREWQGRVTRATLINAFQQAERTGTLDDSKPVVADPKPAKTPRRK